MAHTDTLWYDKGSFRVPALTHISCEARCADTLYFTSILQINMRHINCVVSLIENSYMDARLMSNSFQIEEETNICKAELFWKMPPL